MSLFAIKVSPEKEIQIGLGELFPCSKVGTAAPVIIVPFVKPGIIVKVGSLFLFLSNVDISKVDTEIAVAGAMDSSAISFFGFELFITVGVFRLLEYTILFLPLFLLPGKDGRDSLLKSSFALLTFALLCFIISFILSSILLVLVSAYSLLVALLSLIAVFKFLREDEINWLFSSCVLFIFVIIVFVVVFISDFSSFFTFLILLVSFASICLISLCTPLSSSSLASCHFEKVFISSLTFSTFVLIGFLSPPLYIISPNFTNPIKINIPIDITRVRVTNLLIVFFLTSSLFWSRVDNLSKTSSDFSSFFFFLFAFIRSKTSFQLP